LSLAEQITMNEKSPFVSLLWKLLRCVIARSEATWRSLFHSLRTSFEIASLRSQLSPEAQATMNEKSSYVSLL